MTAIVRATEKDFQILAEIGKTSYIESHGNSAKEAVVNQYLSENYNDEVFKNELGDRKNIYHIIYHDLQPAGYSKIILDAPHPDVQMKNITKLERLYLLKEFYGLKIGFELFNLNLEISKRNNQAGMWLYVWKENHKAVGFYNKMGFKIIGSYDFKITETHSNPNHQMLLKF